MDCNQQSTPAWRPGWLGFGMLWLLAGCSTVPQEPQYPERPSNLLNACVIFAERPDWQDGAEKAYARWGTPPELILAIIYQESSFRATARAPKDKVLGLLPWQRSSAYGLGQVKDETWQWYLAKADSPERQRANRENFASVADFIGWYANLSSRTLGIAKPDAYNHYLAYHEGHGGYRQKTFLSKPWLMEIAQKVKRTAEHYRIQLTRCPTRPGNRWSSF